MYIEAVWSWLEGEMIVAMNMNGIVEQNIGLRPHFFVPISSFEYRAPSPFLHHFFIPKIRSGERYRRKDGVMKTMMKGLIAVLLLIASGAVVLAGDAPIQDEPLPPEVKKLIGMKIPPKIIGKSGAPIPKFLSFGGGMLNRQIGDAASWAELIYEEGTVEEKWAAFIVYASHADKSRVILDARLLPRELINWRFENGKIKWLENEEKLIFSIFCHHGGGNDRIIFGLEDPKYERDGYSTRIERAWEVDPQTGRIKSIPTQGIICAILGE